jgi:putative transcriptional regulator
MMVDKPPGGGDHHAMDPQDSFAPTLLLAMPQLRDPNFSRTVVLLCEYGSSGALGFVVNRPTDVRAAEAVVLDPPVRGDSGLKLWTGGPVEPHRGFLLLGDDPGVVESEKVSDGFHLTASIEVLRRLLESEPAEMASRRARLLLGYAGWGPGQLDQELTASAWLTVPPDPTLVFETPAEHMWERAIRSLGIDPMALQVASGVQ